MRIDNQVADDIFYEDGLVCPEDDCYELDDDTGAKKPLTFKEYYEFYKSPLINSEDKAALLRQRRTENVRIELAAIKMVTYNWALYDALVQAGAQAMLRGTGKHVSLDPSELGSL